MKWPGSLVKGRLLKRYKRFLADVALPDGTVVVAHCANTGSMKTCMDVDIPVWLTHTDSKTRKLKYSWQIAFMPDGWVGINTGLANRLVVEAIQSGVIPALDGYGELRTEQKYGENSRIDILLRDEQRPDCYVEVKNVTLLLEDGIAGFPDAVTKRGLKHLGELTKLVVQGRRAVLLYCVQRESATVVKPAAQFDPDYAAALKHAAAHGVDVLAYRAQLSEDGLELTTAIPVELD